MRDLKMHKTQNYSLLRETFENDFYVGTKIKSNSKKK